MIYRCQQSISLNFHGYFMGQESCLKTTNDPKKEGDPVITAFCKSKSGKRPTLEDYLDQIDYVVQLVGIDHVGVGTDKFEGKTKEEYISEVQSRYPKLISVPFEHRHVEGFSHITYFPRITEGLLAGGCSDEDCSKILGENFLSLFQKVWKKIKF